MNVIGRKKDATENEVDIEVNAEDSEAASTEGDHENPAAVESEVALEAQEEIGRLREAMLRMQAETENTRKRLTRDLERSRKLALELIMKDLLQVRDTLERGLEVDPESASVESLLEGQQLTLKMFNKVLEDHHLEVIDPLGEMFDPELHEAMTVLPSEEQDENTVLEVLQKGFRLHDRLVRPAMVVVSRKP